METTVRQFRRILTALEDLVSQEEMLLRSGDCLAIPPLQLRMAPLVASLLATAEVADEPLRRRVTALIVRRAATQRRLEEDLVRVQEDLQQIRRSGHRLARVAPAYRQSGGDISSSQLSARG